MNKISIFLIFFLVFALSFRVSAQLTVSSPGLTPDGLVQGYLAGDGVVISNVTFNNRETVTETGNPTSTSQVKLGVFEAGGFPISSGLVMSTNSISGVPAGGTSSPIPDLPLDSSLLDLSSALRSKTMLEFDFTAESATFQFEYIFASTEYGNYVCTQFNDVFAFYITGPDPVTYNQRTWNIAVIPGTNPELEVTINNVNGGTPHGSVTPCHLDNTEFYFQNNNQVVNSVGYTVMRAQDEEGAYNGEIVGGLIASSCIVPCETYHMKLTMANVSDNSLNSHVFLKQGSFTSPEVEIVERNFDEQTDTIVPGCNHTDIYYALPVNSPCMQQYTVNYNVAATPDNLVLNEHYTLTPYVYNEDTEEMELTVPITNEEGQLTVSLENVYDPDNENIELPIFRVEMLETADLNSLFVENITVNVFTEICGYLPNLEAVITIPVKGNPAIEMTMPEITNFCENTEEKIIEIGLNKDSILPGYEVIWECDSTLLEVDPQNPDPLSRKIITSDSVNVTVIVIDGIACRSDTLIIPIRIVPFPVADHSIIPVSTTSCAPMEVTLTAEVEPEDARIEWNIESLGQESPDNPYNFTTNEEGRHPYLLVVETAPGCSDTLNGSFTVIDVPVADFTWSPEIAQNGQPVQFTSQATGDSPILQWAWLFGDGGSSSNENPLYTYRVTNDNTFPVQLTVTNESCTHDTIKNISVTDKFSLFVPNAFNPTSDHLSNRTFQPIVREVLKYHLLIYNRQGECLFQSVNTEEGWDGTFNGELCEPGTYVYKIIYVKYNAVDTEIVKTGTLMLVN